MNSEILCNLPANRLGYGVVGVNILYHLSKKKECSLFPIGPIEITEEKYKPVIEDSIKNSRNFPDFNSTCLKIWHQHDLQSRIGNGKYIAWPIFELDKFDEVEKTSLSCPHEIIVCSEWAKQVCINNGVKQDIRVVPLGVDPEIFNPGPPNQNTYKFFTIGKHETRKSHDIIAKCFNSAFSDKDDVELHLMTQNPFPQVNNDEWNRLHKSGPLSDKVILHNPVNSHKEIADFIKSCDCGWFCAKAEGWNLELLESMSSNKPVIATNYSAHTEFCTSKNSFLVDIEKTTVAYDGVWFNGKGNWAHIGSKEEEQIIEHMRYCYRNNIRENPEGVKTSVEFTWEKTVEKLLNVIG